MRYTVKKKGGDGLSHSEQMLAAFNIYRTKTLLEVLDQPQVFVFIDGLVINSSVGVISADPCGLVLEVDRSQLAAFERSRSVVLESPLHGATFRAAVDAVDRRRAYLSLSGLEPYDAYHERRAQIRAVPIFPLLARLHNRGEEARGRVLDLSTHSLAADFDARAFSRVARAAVIRLDVWGETQTSNTFPDFETTAKITRRTQRDENGKQAYRAVLEFDSYPALNRTLRRYVARRQRDLMTELLVEGGQSGDALHNEATRPD